MPACSGGAPPANRADIAAIEAAGWPADLPGSTYELIARTARATPDAPALSFFLDARRHARPERWTYRALLEGVTRTANMLHRLGVGPGDVVAYVLPNLPETHFVLWGAEAAGVAMPVNPLLEAGAIAALLAAARAKVVVTLAPFPGTDLFAKVARAAARVPTLRHLVLVGLADRVRGLRRLPAHLLQWREARRRPPLPAGVGVHGFARATAREPAGALRAARPISADEPSSCFCTGGTTGAPKIARRTHANEVANAWMSARMLGDALGPGAAVFCGLPLFHVNAAMATGLAAFLRGAHVVLGTPQGYRGPGVVERFWEIVARHRISSFSGVPTLYAALLRQPLDGLDISSLRYAFCGAAPMPPGLLRRFEERTGVPVLEGYGLTEGTCVSTLNPFAGERRPGSVGLPLPFQRLRPVVLGPDGAYLRDAEEGEAGAVAIAGPNVFPGYLAEADNAGIWIDRGDGLRWLDTGDLGRVDGDGYLWLTGRRKELIIRGGHNIDPAAIEEALQAHPAVELAAAVSRPDAHAGEVPVAYVQLRPGTRAGPDELRAFADSGIGERAAVPVAVRVVEVMPLTAVGKIFKPRLKEMEAERVVRGALDAVGLSPLDLSVASDARRGTVVRLRLREAADAGAARHALASYALAVDIAGASEAGPTPP